MPAYLSMFVCVAEFRMRPAFISHTSLQGGRWGREIWLSHASDPWRSPSEPEEYEWSKRLKLVVNTLAAMFEQVTVLLVMIT